MAKKAKEFRSQRAAEKAFERLRAKGIYDAGVVYDAYSGRYRLLWDDKKGNPSRGRKLTVTQKRARASRAAKTRGIVKAVKGLLKKTNPSAKITGASVVKLKGGVLKITPIKANPGGLKRALSEYGHQRRGGTSRIAAVKRAISSTRRNSGSKRGRR